MLQGGEEGKKSVTMTVMTMLIVMHEMRRVGVRIELAKMMRRCERWELARGSDVTTHTHTHFATWDGVTQRSRSVVAFADVTREPL